MAKPYETLADAFRESTPDKLYVEAEAASRIWAEEANTGLVKQVLQVHRRFQVLALSKTYASVPLVTVASILSSPNHNISPQGISAYLESLISSRQLHATITSSSESSQPALRFLSTDGAVPEPEAQEQAKLKASASKVQGLAMHIKDAQRRIELSKEYLDASKKRKKMTKDAPGEGLLNSSGPPPMPGGYGGDEEMLAEY